MRRLALVPALGVFLRSFQAHSTPRTSQEWSSHRHASTLTKLLSILSPSGRQDASHHLENSGAAQPDVSSKQRSPVQQEGEFGELISLRWCVVLARMSS